MVEAIEKHARSRDGAARIAGRRRRMPRTLLQACTIARIGVLGLALAGCSSSLLSVGAPPGSLPSLPQPPRQAQQQQLPAATQREHQRILAA
jgi:hypothetical protein